MAAAAMTPRPKSKSLFWPSGPITAKFSKGREQLHKADDPLVWNKSGPPTHEVRVQKGAEVPALIDAKNPARLAGKAVIELKRDLNSLMHKSKEGGQTVMGRLLQPPGKSFTSKDEKRKESELDDWSDDELWESLGRPAGTSRGELKKKAIAKLVSDRCLDSVKHTSRPGSAMV
eukprot:TRINITY_DN4982_c0_g1_i1.p2 TRINITY_DN4982_c0_g1~~TRINITY_DN4982_c0_g1_i1.p2  ORF type:complete len:174 (-),score=36.96 TRINITY_DN4982_c0_g1_i1:173-694(-)